MRELVPSAMFSGLRRVCRHGLTGAELFCKIWHHVWLLMPWKIWPAGIHMDKRDRRHLYKLLQGQRRGMFSALNIKPFIGR